MKWIKFIRELLFIIITNQMFFLFGCSGSTEITSKYPDNKVIIDGKDNEWENKTTYLKDDNVLIGIQNDNDYLYLLISTTDRQKQMQILNTGLNIWFDANGGTSKKIGIRFPIGRIESSQQFTANKEGQAQDQENNSNENNLNQNNFTEFEIFEPETNNWSKNGFNVLQGFEAKISKNNGRLVCEYRIPLQSKNSDFYIPVTGRKLKIGIETNISDYKNFRKRTNPGRESDGREGNTRIPNEGSRHQRNGGRQDQEGRGRFGSQGLKDFNRWFDVTLTQK